MPLIEKKNKFRYYRAIGFNLARFISKRSEAELICECVEPMSILVRSM